MSEAGWGMDKPTVAGWYWWRFLATKDGEVDSHRTCPQCLVVRYWLEKECGGWVYGTIEEDIVEHAREGSCYPVPQWMSLARMAVGIQGKWQTGKMPKLALITGD